MLSFVGMIQKCSQIPSLTWHCFHCLKGKSSLPKLSSLSRCWVCIFLKSKQSWFSKGELSVKLTNFFNILSSMLVSKGPINCLPASQCTSLPSRTVFPSSVPILFLCKHTICRAGMAEGCLNWTRWLLQGLGSTETAGILVSRDRS